MSRNVVAAAAAGGALVGGLATAGLLALIRSRDAKAAPLKEEMHMFDEFEKTLQGYAPDIDPGLVTLLFHIARASARIGELLRTSAADAKAGSVNKYGDEQLKVDLDTDAIVFEELHDSGSVAAAASEETPEETNCLGDGYCVGFDPLDGSSVVDANFSVGSIFGIWPGRTILGKTGRDQCASAVAVYGPRATLAIALPASVTGKEAVAFELTHAGHGMHGDWTVTRRQLNLKPAGKVFAPGNLRASTNVPAYGELVGHWLKERYTLRYTGAMILDVYHMLIKSKGIFTNVPEQGKNAKLRLVYEVAPIGLLVECAGGVTTCSDKLGSVLDVPIDDLDKRLGLCFGSRDEVAVFARLMFGDAAVQQQQQEEEEAAATEIGARL